MAARYAVGIDLGTTNTVVAWAPIDGGADVRVLDVPQLVASGAVENRKLLPSALYAPLDAERIEDPFGDAPWAIGELARRRGAEVPGRLVASSKSWLVHSAVDRTAAILPWGVPADVPKLSPVDAAARLLEHVRRSWDALRPDAPMAEQDVVLTVPASFDEVARELSLDAARRAGLSPKLLEEPQAAFYDWMSGAGPEALASRVASTAGGAVVLVVDVGGGTTDLSLIRIEGRERVVRLAVGPHVLLGGDNMDLALAHACEPRLCDSDTKLDAGRFAQLVAACRSAKERLLGTGAPDDLPVTVAGRGAALVGGARTTRLSREETERIVLEGFFPRVAADARPQRLRSAIVAFGLPYERDAAITRHVAAFVARHLDGAWPDAVLFNGGVFRAARIADRFVDVLREWRGGATAKLSGTDPDLAVARGAVAYARARTGRGVRIGGGTARGYFVGVGVEEGGRSRAVCVVPRGAEEGAVHVASGRALSLAVGRPVRFDLFAGEVDARPGDVVDVDDESFSRLPPLVTTLEGREGLREIEVGVEGELTPIGTVDLACFERRAEPARRYRLAFQLRQDGAAPALRPSVAPGPSRRVDDAVDRVDRAFGKARADAGAREAKDLIRELERLLGDRSEWTTETNRALFDALVPRAAGRRRSEDHERVFWLLAGWCIRPGFGDPDDPRRVDALFARFDERLAFPAEARGWQQFWIAWRRAAGGLRDDAQERIRRFVDPHLAPEGSGRRPKKSALALDDALDMASTLERIAPERRSELGGRVLERTWTDRDPRLWSAIGRLGARVPSYASAHHVVAPHVAERWLSHLLREKWENVPTAEQAAVRLARRTGDRARDVGEDVRREVLQRLVAAGASEDRVLAVREVVPVEESDRVAFFGDALPLGLKLVS